MIGVEDVVAEAGEGHLFDGWICLKCVEGLADGDFGSFGDRVAVDAAADGGEGESAEIVFADQGEAGAIAACEQIGFALAAAIPDWADSVDHVTRRKPVAFGDFGVTGFAAMEQSAFGKQLRAGSAVDSSVYASAAEQGAVGGVDDGVYCESGDVGFEDGDAVRHGNLTSAFHKFSGEPVKSGAHLRLFTYPGICHT